MHWSKHHPPAPDSQPAALVSASGMLGWDVLGPAGDLLGTLSDLLLDLDRGTVLSAEVSSGGFLGAGEVRRQVRWDQLHALPTRRALLLDEAQSSPGHHLLSKT